MGGKKKFLVDKFPAITLEFTHYLKLDEQIKKRLSTPKALNPNVNTSYADIVYCWQFTCEFEQCIEAPFSVKCSTAL
jgi:hypothetical protein